MSENGTATTTKYPAVRVGALGHDAATIVASLGFTKDDAPAAVVAAWFELVDLMASAVEDLIDEDAAPPARNYGGGNSGGGGLRVLNKGDDEAIDEPVPDWMVKAAQQAGIDTIRDYRAKAKVNAKHPHFKSGQKINGDYKPFWPPRGR